MTLTATTECPHGVKITYVDTEPEECSNEEFSWFLRAQLLACPRCHHDAEAFLGEPRLP